MQTTLRSLPALFAVAVLPAFQPSSAPRAVDGYTVSYQMTGMASGPTSVTMKFSGEKMRLEFDMSSMMGGRGDMGAMVAGAFMLVQAQGKVAMVLPGMRMALSMDVGAMAARGGRGSAAACPTQASIDDLGAGETIAGHPTHKYRIRTTSASGEQVTEAWLATDMAGVEDAFGKMGESMNVGASKCVGDVLKAKTVKGFPLKYTSHVDGKEMTMEATRAEKSSFDASEFEVPAGIQTMDGSMMMGGRRGGGE